ncbi:BadF/BadG/BcrA/BcrD ATPase family protein [Vagococcus fluvialis]|uniref:BadF/BadG/BcrA/BcrD ATPase family protein n=1 Tax=Vagococcus fluvialis TaxID=2738 RepID=UPI001D0AF287|nr:BadF/BadG/BcrA/BcrD ATPase family protein [Vagococcus fluvialis]MDT2747524.1 BadF/BadG/BcrA/BcrD ATPase family protein [Vagococcus fluvialis]UDM70996.1 hypothetical protein K5L00_12920 [Vagococcus fluvialis]UDM75854.1 hypothetical protein K5K98_08455 [Vagococcus fluvialis]UDM82684.1 hypothetical protein K5K96_01125 [Vagococcus fluvialis]
MNYILGVDCGGTKTEAEAYSLDGKLLASSTYGFGNVIVDYEAGLSHIKEAINAIFEKLPKEKCVGITLGIAGIDSGGLKTKVKSDLSVIHENIHLINDGQLAHYSILKGADGVTVTAGTGSVILGLEDNQWFRVGGWGHLFGDEGGAYFIAKRGIQEALKEYDNNQSPSELTKKIFSYFGVTTVLELTKKVYSLDKGDLAASAIVVANLAENNHTAASIINEAGEDLATGILQCLNKMPELEKPIKIGLNGSVVEKNHHVLEALSRKLDQKNLVYELNIKKESCAKGAYYLNQRNGDKK